MSTTRSTTRMPDEHAPDYVWDAYLASIESDEREQYEQLTLDLNALAEATVSPA